MRRPPLPLTREREWRSCMTHRKAVLVHVATTAGLLVLYITQYSCTSLVGNENTPNIGTMPVLLTARDSLSRVMLLERFSMSVQMRRMQALGTGIGLGGAWQPGDRSARHISGLALMTRLYIWTVFLSKVISLCDLLEPFSIASHHLLYYVQRASCMDREGWYD
jgi:hypothetical protein